MAAAERVIRYTSNKNFDDLKADDMMYYAVVKNIEIIGEAANLLSPEFVASHSDTPWKQVRGMRNYTDTPFLTPCAQWSEFIRII